MKYERRRAPRHAFSGIAEVTIGTSDVRVGRVKDLSLEGAYVAMSDPGPENSTVQLTISAGTAVFRCAGTVAYSTQGIGMGVRFRNILPASRSVLEGWLKESGSMEMDARKAPTV